jgi:adenine C2-methylase RlmN of 23S rRNA A2503 and tRNA A37
VEVKIGVQHVARDLVIETDESAETIEKLVDEALESEGVLSLTDNKGRKVLVPTAKLAFVEIGIHTGQVGFRH